MLLCDGPGPCNKAVHTWCCDPPLGAVPEGPFFCCSACECSPEPGRGSPNRGRLPFAPGPALASRPAGGSVAKPERVAVGPVDSFSPPPLCDVCLRSVDSLRVLSCVGCGAPVHPTCLGLGPNSYPAGWFECAEFALLSTRLELGATLAPSQLSRSAVEAAHNLVWLRGKRVQDSSQATYASALHRYVRFVVSELGQPAAAALPPGLKVPPPSGAVQLFVAWAVARYKVSSVRVTLNALADWCKSKQAPVSSVHCAEVEQLLHSAAVGQGHAGLPVGKRGLSKPELQLCIPG